jgi:hypothetical protein
VETILQILSSYGWQGFIVLLLVWTFYLFFIKNDIKKTVENFYSEEIEVKQTPQSLKHHPLFRHLQYKIDVEIPTIIFCPDKPVKQQVFTDMLIMLVKNINDTCLSICHDDIEAWEAEEWANHVSGRMVKCINSWVSECIQNEIPFKAVSKFKTWATGNFSIINEYITILVNSRDYENNITRTHTFFLIINLLVVALIGDAERTVKDVNGDIAGLKYKGNKIEG